MDFRPPRDLAARWRPLEGEGLEHLTLAIEGEEIVARGVVIGDRGERPYGVDYTILCDHAFRVRGLDLGTTEGMALSLRSDGEGHWVNHDGRPLPEFDGCVDLDLAGTPFTNTLPIRRIDWTSRGGSPLRLSVLYVPFGNFVPRPDGQIYTRLSDRRFLYESADGGFSAELTVDEDGLVLDYPQLFTRLPAQTA